MTEAEWLVCNDPAPMLELLCAGRKASERKLRLFACACYRRIPADSDGEHPGVLTGERYADGQDGWRELEHARSQIGGVGAYSATASANNAVGAVVSRRAATAARWAARHASDYFGHIAWEAEGFSSTAGQSAFLSARIDERKRQASLLREIIGSPFRAATLNPAWLAWNGGTVAKLAHSVYDERAFDRLPVLADALEESGCADPAILDHCRGPGPHVRGCWVVDLLLGKA